MDRTDARSLQLVASARLPTRWGEFEIVGYERAFPDGAQPETAYALILGDVEKGAPLLRLHSQCFTGEILGSLRCDCCGQLELAMQRIAEEGAGLLVYEHQEGRGIGLLKKLQAYSLQDAGFDTIDANRALGLEPDRRDFALSTAIVRKLGVSRVRLLSNNSLKSRALSFGGIEVVEQIPCEVAPTPDSYDYLLTKRERLGHALSRVPGRTATRAVPLAQPSDAAPFVGIDVALRELRAGRIVVVVDDDDRENEGDLTIAASAITPAAVNFMATHGRGLICLAMSGERLDRLDLGPMAQDNTALGGTSFTVSIDVKGRGVTTGISARDRAETIRAALDERSTANDFARPGHVFPLRAAPGGVLERRGHTEAAVDLATLAGLPPAGVICEVVNEDGTMARVPDLVRFCRMHGLVMLTVAELARYRLELGAKDELASAVRTLSFT